MTIKMILCTDLEGGIGKEGKLPWGNSHSEDLQYFKQQTLGCNVIMGHNTYKSLEREFGLPDRTNFVLSSQWRDLCTSEKMEEGLFFVGESFIDRKIKGIGKSSPFIGDTWIIGGKSLYEKYIDYVDAVHHSFIDKKFDCDTYVDCDLWEESSNLIMTKCEKLSENGLYLQVYKRK